jgi:hypothetical protein
MLNQNACARCISLNMVNEGFWVIGNSGPLFSSKRGPGLASIPGGVRQLLSLASGAASHSRQAATPTPRSASLALASWALSSSAERFRLSRRKIAAFA